jgi:hypothetical protein
MWCGCACLLLTCRQFVRWLRVHIVSMISFLYDLALAICLMPSLVAMSPGSRAGRMHGVMAQGHRIPHHIRAGVLAGATSRHGIHGVVAFIFVVLACGLCTCMCRRCVLARAVLLQLFIAACSIIVSEAHLNDQH